MIYCSRKGRREGGTFSTMCIILGGAISVKVSLLTFWIVWNAFQKIVLGLVPSLPDLSHFVTLATLSPAIFVHLLKGLSLYSSLRSVSVQIQEGDRKNKPLGGLQENESGWKNIQIGHFFFFSCFPHPPFFSFSFPHQFLKKGTEFCIWGIFTLAK